MNIVINLIGIILLLGIMYILSADKKVFLTKQY